MWAPLSEQYGRRDLTVSTFLLFTLSTMACALAPSWPAFLVFRLFAGVFASAPIAVVTGIFADIYGDARTRGRGMALFMVVRKPSWQLQTSLQPRFLAALPTQTISLAVLIHG